MIDLKDVLDSLYELSELRTRAKELREASRVALQEIEDTSTPQDQDVKMKDPTKAPLESWMATNENVEVALLVKVQDHRDLSESDDENDNAESSPALRARLRSLSLKDLFPRAESTTEGDNDVPVLLAARAMQSLLTHASSVFSAATMLCYYRIVRELYIAAGPDWTVGAARAGTGGRTSAFITGECIRAIFALGDQLKRTAEFFKHTDRLIGRYELLRDMMSVFPAPAMNALADSSLQRWIKATLERMWFDWYISTNPRHGDIALHAGTDANQLLFHPVNPPDMQSLGNYLDELPRRLKEAIEQARKEIAEAKRQIAEFRKDDQGKFFVYRLDTNGLRREPSSALASEEDWHNYYKELREYDRAESAHQFAYSLVGKAEAEAEQAETIVTGVSSNTNSLKDDLNKLILQFERMSAEVHKVLDPAKRYIRNVLYREIAAKMAFGKFDAGEMVFAASAFGAITNWHQDELLTKACEVLVEALPENGRLPSTRPFQSTRKGHRMIPIGCEMTRSLAQLLQRTGFKFEPKTVRRMLNIFEERPIKLTLKDRKDQKTRIGWNFDGSPSPDRPCVWVTAVSVLAIDRVVRMLNERINSVIFGHFQVVYPSHSQEDLTLNDLVYSDIGFNNYYVRPAQPSIGLRLEQMRAHVMRAGLPEIYNNKNEKERFFSAILYGPPGTGKTTLAEALARSSEVPLIRLSPSDLIVQGHSALEGRARTVFEALSMLTQTVVILDEFEGVVGVSSMNSASRTHELEAFELLRRGMLPKLARLYDSAKSQSLVYCLATNFLARIDPAAKRLRRFDLHLPIYAPDPLSRAGMLLYRLYRIERKLNKHAKLSKEPTGIVRRFSEIVEVTRYMRANSLAEDYFRLPEWEDVDDPPPPNFEKEIPFFWFISTGNKIDEYDIKIQQVEDERRKTKDQVELANPFTEQERQEYEWLVSSEESITELLKTGSNITLNELDLVLRQPSMEGTAQAKQKVDELLQQRAAHP